MHRQKISYEWRRRPFLLAFLGICCLLALPPAQAAVSAPDVPTPPVAAGTVLSGAAISVAPFSFSAGAGKNLTDEERQAIALHLRDAIAAALLDAGMLVSTSDSPETTAAPQPQTPSAPEKPDEHKAGDAEPPAMEASAADTGSSGNATAAHGTAEADDVDPALTAALAEDARERNEKTPVAEPTPHHQSPAYTLSGSITLLQHTRGASSTIGAVRRLPLSLQLRCVYLIHHTGAAEPVQRGTAGAFAKKLIRADSDVQAAQTQLVDEALAAAAHDLLAGLQAKQNGQNGQPHSAPAATARSADDERRYYEDSPGKRLRDSR